MRAVIALQVLGRKPRNSRIEQWSLRDGYHGRTRSFEFCVRVLAANDTLGITLYVGSNISFYSDRTASLILVEATTRISWTGGRQSEP